MKTALVTGGTVRIGKAISSRLESDGWRVVTTSHRSGAGADVEGDLSVPGGADRLFESVTAFLGGMPDALVNNAGIYSGCASAIESVCFLAPARLMELMAGRSVPGVVVNILDADVLSGDGAGSAYLSAKAALLEETRKAAVRHAGKLRVNAVAPGSVLPPPGMNVKAGPMPFGRPRPEDVASAVSFLLSARTVTGAVIQV